MQAIKTFSQIPLCYFGVHAPPPPRYPHGPVVADCPYCGKTCYYYGLAAYGVGGPPILMPILIRPLPQAR